MGGCTYVAFHTQSCSFCVKVYVLDPLLRVWPILSMELIVVSSFASGIACLPFGEACAMEWTGGTEAGSGNKELVNAEVSKSG